MHPLQSMQRFGWLLPVPGRPTVLLAGTLAQIDSLYPAVDAALRRRPGYRLVLAAPPGDVAALRSRYTHETVLDLPRRMSERRWRHALDVRLVIGPGCSPMALDDLAAVQSQLEKLPPPVLAASATDTGTRLVDRLGGRRLGSIDALRQSLGTPHTVICLGNGPSSEDARLAQFRPATLFRVNWTWRHRGILSKPDAVFTADPDLPPLRNRAVIVFPTAVAGAQILIRQAMAARIPRAGYMFLDELEPPPCDLRGAIIPTNGALMVAMAVALEPARIVIAGMDMYRHPQGRYPGAGAAIDGYAREHSPGLDLMLVGSALRQFKGEIINLSDNLRAALDASQSPPNDA